MDSLTQIVLGAAVAELALGKKVGNKAALWGAICGTIPDLDVLANPFLTDLQELGSHRGFSHSIFFSFLLSPLLGYLISVFYRKKEANWKEWTFLCFLSLFTHPLLDAFTNYGTQLFLPFSNYRVAFNSIFIVDPCYTLPMLLFLAVAMFLNRKKNTRSTLNKIGIVLSHTYLVFTLANKLYVGAVFEEAMEKKQIACQRYMTNPMPLQNIMWYLIAEEKEGFYYGYYSWYDDPNKMSFMYFPKNDKGLDQLKKTFPIKRLSWFSDGYYVFTRKDNKLYLNDLRFGKAGSLVNGNGDFIMQWEIKQHNGVVEIEKHMPNFEWNKKSFNELISRIKGIKKDTL